MKRADGALSAEGAELEKSPERRARVQRNDRLPRQVPDDLDVPRITRVSMTTPDLVVLGLQESAIDTSNIKAGGLLKMKTTV